jgi:hypothetical protein
MQEVTTTITTNTNPDTGAITMITRTTVVSHPHFHYGLFLLAILASALIACGLRTLFWNKDSN